MDTTVVDTFTATEIARELEIVQGWAGPEVDAFLRDVTPAARSFDEWLTMASAWAAGVDTPAK